VGQFAEFFKFAAKAGSLEGYLYEREQVESLHNWVSNIEKMYRGLPDDIKEDTQQEFREVLRKILMYGDRMLEKDLKTKLMNLLSEL
jgi:hypothetical protein